MNAYKIADALGNIGGDLVRDAGDCAKKTNKKSLKKLMIPLIAAILAAVAAVSGILIANRRAPAVPRYDKAMFSAEDIAAIFSGANGPTKAYREVCAPSGDQLYIDPAPDTEYLKIYELSYPDCDLDKDEFKSFADDFFKKSSAALGIAVPEYKIEKLKSSSPELRASIDIHNQPYNISCSQQSLYYNGIPVNCAQLNLNTSNTDRMYLNSKLVSVDQRDSDVQIAEKITDIRDELFDLTGESFSDMKIIRSYGGSSVHGVENISIYFYNAADALFDERNPLCSYIVLYFDNVINYNGDIVSDTELTNARVYYYSCRTDRSEYLKEKMEVKMLSVSEAEILLNKGFVFGGHNCSLCMAEQDAVDFSDYDYVGFEYLSARDGRNDSDDTKMLIPFYTFYKVKGTSENGNIIYAKTYVPAIEVNGLEEYFDMQAQNHYIYY